MEMMNRNCEYLKFISFINVIRCVLGLVKRAKNFQTVTRDGFEANFAVNFGRSSRLGKF